MTDRAAGQEGGAILALNAGSSSIKFGVFSANPELQPISRGEIDHPPSDAGDFLLDQVASHLGGRRLVAVGHRIVHGGSHYAAPVKLTTGVVAELRALTPLAPLHQPLGLAPVEAIAKARPDLLQVACFDTAFHRSIQPPADRYAIPREYEEKGIRRYGFHGLSYEYIVSRLREISPELVDRKTVIAHLGSGASLCAARDGHSVDTTMGFSALDGLVMATRPGSIDPGILLYLLKEQGFTADRLEKFLYHECGLLGASGISGDIRDLLKSSDPRAQDALDLFTFSVSRQIALMANSLGGLELLVFTGGIGEHAADVRSAVVRRLSWLGAALDESANALHEERISVSGSAIDIRVMPTNEELVIAKHTEEVLGRTM